MLLEIALRKGHRHHRVMGRSNQRGRNVSRRFGSKSNVPKRTPAVPAVVLLKSGNSGRLIARGGRSSHAPMEPATTARRAGKSAKSKTITGTELKRAIYARTITKACSEWRVGRGLPVVRGSWPGLFGSSLWWDGGCRALLQGRARGRSGATGR